MRADRQGKANVGDRVTNVNDVGAEPASDVQLGGQNAIEVVHEIVENDQRDHVSITIVQKENNDRQHPENGCCIGQIPIDEISRCPAHVQDASARRTKK
ncbi:MAG: hypothetical protein O7I42_02675 [Alphaproteobacteria bacterium]|nr:hypothetical protein [Alphaproteobacteria bacterium]